MERELDSFALYCLAAEIRPAETLRVLGLIERRLAGDPENAEIHLYKGALLSRMGLEIQHPAQAQRFLKTGVGIMRTIQPVTPMRSLTHLRMLYARGTTQVILPVPPMTVREIHEGIVRILDHPGFGMLHGSRRAVVLGMQAHLLKKQGQDRMAARLWQAATRIEKRISGFPDAPPQIIL
ncbi:hypothetical protein [Paracoccus alkanivorans]|uniref:Tetratricopeptide repeat protein n=1 Tax=Paracoccus alkanivorans TaxID=2116655 RepID=A0A3M0MM49_9RHOB|nr:hypothetical protein [Paracoccus alkanivorans]RMC32357.1 hypothetical protein C9E81_18380 [Paracoccus alkanivorans]